MTVMLMITIKTLLLLITMMMMTISKHLQSFTQYPGYRTRSSRGENATLYARYKHDLALIQLAEDAGVEPICLPTGDAAEPEVQNSSDDSNMASRFRQTALESKGECWVSGWGFTRGGSCNGCLP